VKSFFALGCFAAIVTSILCAGVSVSKGESKEAKISIARDGEKSIVVKASDREAMEYRCQETPNKPYVKRLFTPDGVQILRDSPGDHKHHHALMFALKADNVDFWSEEPNAGIEKSTAIESLNSRATDGFSRADFTQKLDWNDQTGKTLVKEVRRIELFSSPELKATLLSWHAKLEPAAGKEKVDLGGEHYFGLGMRFVPSMDETGEFINSENKEGESIRGSEKLTSAKWCAYRSKADGKPVTVAIFDSPKNPRHPNNFFTMRPFAYLAATLNLWKEPLTLKAGEPLELAYGVAAWDGSINAAEIEKTYQQWLKIEKEEKH
jgi:hypothetical protein